MSVLTVFTLGVLSFGLGNTFWTVAGVARFLGERVGECRTSTARPKHRRSASNRPVACTPSRVRRGDVAALIAARNEGAVLEQTLEAVLQLLPRRNIHVISDGSTDQTADIARSFGVQLLELDPNRGKAGALDAGIRHFNLKRNFRVMLLLDADTRLASDYFETGLPAFDDPGIVAVTGSSRSLLDPPPKTLMGRFLIAYRARLYVQVNFLDRYGQASRWANCISVVPGFASMYRTDVLEKIDITAPGLVIEDINMTFEIHAKKLGRIAFHPCAAVAFTQDPDNPRDYIRQIRRWSLGYWQTVRRHRLRLGKFWVVVAATCAELVFYSIFLLLMPVLLAFVLYSQTLAASWGYLEIGATQITATLPPDEVMLGALLPEFVLSLLAAVVLRRPSMLLLAPAMPLMRVLEAYVVLRAIPEACVTRSSGRWISPTRRGSAAMSAASANRVVS